MLLGFFKFDEIFVACYMVYTVNVPCISEETVYSELLDEIFYKCLLGLFVENEVKFIVNFSFDFFC
jgi:hypothetical protein